MNLTEDALLEEMIREEFMGDGPERMEAFEVWLTLRVLGVPEAPPLAMHHHRTLKSIRESYAVWIKMVDAPGRALL